MLYKFENVISLVENSSYGIYSWWKPPCAVISISSVLKNESTWPCALDGNLSQLIIALLCQMGIYPSPCTWKQVGGSFKANVPSEEIENSLVSS